MAGPEARSLDGNVRRFAAVATLLTFAGGMLLYGPSDNTEDWFAWDIEPPLTAGFLGASFLATTLVALSAAIRNTWESIRLVIPMFGVLLLLTLTATLMHLDRFDFNSFFGWTWLAAYALLPGFLGPIVAEQRRVHDRTPRRQPFSLPMALALSILGTALVAEGVALFVDPAAAGRFWPWPLTPLTARAIAAWLVAFGVGAVHASWQRDWSPFLPMAIAFTGFGVLQLLALARWGEVVDWDEVAAWIFLGAVLAILALGVIGLVKSGLRPRAQRSQPRA